MCVPCVLFVCGRVCAWFIIDDTLCDYGYAICDVIRARQVVHHGFSVLIVNHKAQT
jgi:hypothetical protein